MIGRALATPSITVHLMGGLGNQLFQYAFGRHLALSNNAELYLDASGYGEGRTADGSKGLRVCELGAFHIVGKIISGFPPEAEPDALLRRRIRKLQRLAHRLVDLHKPYHARQEIREPHENAFRFDPAVLGRTFTRPVSVRGFWQSEKYFGGIESVLRQDLTWREELPAVDGDLAHSIREGTSVAVHVRHGDNANAIAASLGVLPRHYYEESICAVGAEVGRPRFFVFSDDIAWAAKFLGATADYTLVSRPGAVGSQRDLRLMSYCKHHIIANSTFGWWGAWLGKSDGQIVYAPRRYYQNIERTNPDLYPPHWKLVET